NPTAFAGAGADAREQRGAPATAATCSVEVAVAMAAAASPGDTTREGGHNKRAAPWSPRTAALRTHRRRTLARAGRVGPRTEALAAIAGCGAATPRRSSPPRPEGRPIHPGGGGPIHSGRPFLRGGGVASPTSRRYACWSAGRQAPPGRLAATMR